MPAFDSATATSRRPIPRCWVSARTARSATITGQVGRHQQLSAALGHSSDGRKDYGVYWPDWNANSRATFIVDAQGTIRFIERYGRGELPEPDKILAEIKKL